MAATLPFWVATPKWLRIGFNSGWWPGRLGLLKNLEIVIARPAYGGSWRSQFLLSFEQVAHPERRKAARRVGNDLCGCLTPPRRAVSIFGVRAGLDSDEVGIVTCRTATTWRCAHFVEDVLFACCVTFSTLPFVRVCRRGGPREDFQHRRVCR